MTASATRSALSLRADDRRRLAVARLAHRLLGGGDGPQPFLSVLIPTFNRGVLLAGRTIPSVLSQTYRRFEVVVVGDACTDDTEARLRALGDARVRFENLAERGPYPEDPLLRWMVAGTAPLNRALELARGRWLAYIDDDDVWEPDHLETLLGHARSSGAEFVYASGLFERSPDEWLRLGAWPPAPGHVPHSCTLYRRYLRFMRYDMEAWRAGIGVDSLMWSRMAAAGVRFSFIDRVVASSPLRPGEDLRGQKAAERAHDAYVAENAGTP